MIETNTRKTIITEDKERWHLFTNWLCVLGRKLYPQSEWSVYGPHPDSSSFTPDALRICVRLTWGHVVIVDILWLVAEWMLALPADAKPRAAKALLNKIVSCAESYIFIDDSFCEEEEK